MGSHETKPLSRGREGTVHATGARALERPRRKRGPGRATGAGVRVRRRTAIPPSKSKDRALRQRVLCHTTHPPTPF
ncbi:hypothetical protein DGN16_18040 [Xanthomonas citri pv. fuscans]|nr:hypothetical protein DGN16_18040 [Xanthomonas citri pv. fuscans]QWN08974.1 hypothetical protein DGN11_17550 [Xanthomonas citri pv. fuscans]QWN13164.1 hypothetical protein DGN07_17985 [Xanthomonas citri pv. fuscans]